MYDTRMLKVFGHISPDTDATGSAILWAWYLNTHRTEKAEAFVLGALNKETSFVLNKWNIPEPTLLENIKAGDDVVIVDTNSPQELLPNILEANIIEVIDHHRLSGGLETKGPLTMHILPFASTASVIFHISKLEVENLPDDMAGLLLSCILSDTLAFRSPTTTPHDKDLAERLGKKLGIDIHKYADEMFHAKSDVSDFSDIGLVHLDSKKTALGEKNIRVSVVETTDPKSILDRKEGIISAIKNLLAEEKDTDEVLFFIVDILKEEATVLISNDFVKNIIENSFEVKVSGDTAVLPGIVSRKKQILPTLQIPQK